MKYLLKYSHEAQKQLDRLEYREYLRVYKGILKLRDNPRPYGAIKLKKKEYYRLRMGSYRVIYEIEQKQKTVLIVRVLRRNEQTYKNL